MESVYKSIAMLCLIAYISGVLLNFSSTNYTAKAVRLVVALYIITAFCSPVTDIDIPELKTETIEISIQQTENYVIEKAENNLADYICRLLNEQNISYTDVRTHINKQREKLEIDDITISGVSKEYFDDVTHIMKKADVAQYVHLEE